MSKSTTTPLSRVTLALALAIGLTLQGACQEPARTTTTTSTETPPSTVVAPPSTVVAPPRTADEPPATQIQPPTPAPSPASSPSAPPIEAVPNQSLGPIRIGMTVSDLEATGLQQAASPESRMRRLGPYLVLLDDQGLVYDIGIELRNAPGGVRVGDATIPGDASSLEAMRSSLSDCEPIDFRIGANISTCSDGGLRLTEAGLARILSVVVTKRVTN